MRYFIANWKANKNLRECLDWINAFITLYKTSVDKKVVICPPAPLIYPLKDKISGFPGIALGAQDVSRYDTGSYTGEVTAKSLQGLVEFAILGHSETRTEGNQTNEQLVQKIQMAAKYGIEPVLCVRNRDDIPDCALKYITYEPVHSIGTGDNESLEQVLSAKAGLNLPAGVEFLYGGSVNSKVIGTYLASSEINGFMIGKASLDPQSFYSIISSVQ